MSQDPLHTNTETGNDWLSRSFDAWEAGEPSADLWTELDESLSVESVWNRVGQSLTIEEHLEDAWIADSHAGWNPSPEKDGWAKLNDAISLEQVWVELNETLGQPVATRIPVWKLAAACIVALFMTRKLSDTPFTHLPEHHAPQQQTIISSEEPQLAQESPAGAVTIPTPPAGASSRNDLTERTPSVQQRNAPAVHSANNEPASQHVAGMSQQDRISQPELANTAQPASAQPQGTVAEPADEIVPDEAISDLTIDPLEKRTWGLPTEQLHFDNSLLSPPKPIQHWTIQAGTQLSILQERNRELLTSTMPRFGMAADVSYRHRIQSFQLIHALGMSQYSQGAGKYINGRYCNTDQHINTLQFSSSLAYTYKRFTFYGGILLSRMLSGLEQKNDAVTQVYNFNQVQPGFTGGIDFRLTTLRRTGQTISLGSQYQWLPSLSTQKTSFENIQGIRFQAKFSF